MMVDSVSQTICERMVLCICYQSTASLRYAVHMQELLELMDVRLVEFEDRWESGRLQTCGFESQEVIHLVKALFEDTEMRRRVLHIVAST